MTYDQIKRGQARNICKTCIAIFNFSYKSAESACLNAKFYCAKKHFKKAIFYLNRAHKIATKYKLDDLTIFCISHSQSLNVHFPTPND